MMKTFKKLDNIQAGMVLQLAHYDGKKSFQVEGKSERLIRPINGPLMFLNVGDYFLIDSAGNEWYEDYKTFHQNYKEVE